MSCHVVFLLSDIECIINKQVQVVENWVSIDRWELTRQTKSIKVIFNLQS